MYAKNLNIERADVELINDNSKVIVDGYKVEGPGVLVKSINNAYTRLNLFNAAWWGNKIEENALFGNIFCYPDEEKYCLAFRVYRKTKEERKYIKECSEKLEGLDALRRPWGCLIKRIDLE